MAEPDDRRQRIMEAAYACFSEHGYAGTSTLAIARQARVSKRELYSLFGSKQAILGECISARTAQMQPPPSLPAPTGRPELEIMLRQLGVAILRVLGSNDAMAVYRLAITEIERAPEVARQLDESGRQGAMTLLRGLFADAVQNGVLQGETDDLMESYFALLGAECLTLHLLLRIAEPPDEAAMRARSDRAARLFLRLAAE